MFPVFHEDPTDTSDTSTPTSTSTSTSVPSNSNSSHFRPLSSRPRPSHSSTSTTSSSSSSSSHIPSSPPSLIHAASMMSPSSFRLHGRPRAASDQSVTFQDGWKEREEEDEDGDESHDQFDVHPRLPRTRTMPNSPHQPQHRRGRRDGLIEANTSWSIPVHQFVHSDLDEPITLSQSLIKTLTHSVIDKDAITQHLKYIIDILSGIREQQRALQFYDHMSKTLAERRLTISSAEDAEVVDWISSEYLTESHRRQHGSGNSSSSIMSALTSPASHLSSPTAKVAKDLIGPVESAAEYFTKMRNVVKFVKKLRKAVRRGSLHAVCPNRCLSLLTLHIFEYWNLFEQFKITPSTFAHFITAVEDGYHSKNPYHNNIHATDVTQTMFYFLNIPEFASKITAQDMLAGIIAAAIHDLKHPGTNNQFQVMSHSELAITYNDRSVLENMHCAEAFSILKREECNIFSNMEPAQRTEIRSMIIAMVLATDMQQHFTMIAELKANLEKKKAKGVDFDHTVQADRLLCMDVAMHCADLGNPLKPLSQYLRWTDAVMQEFFLQGDLERSMGLPVSLMMDRTKPNIERSQIGFMDVIVKPLYELFEQICPRVKECLSQLAMNKQYWQLKLDQKHAAALEDARRMDRNNKRSQSQPNALTPTLPLKGPTTIIRKPESLQQRATSGNNAHSHQTSNQDTSSSSSSSSSSSITTTTTTPSQLARVSEHKEKETASDAPSTGNHHDTSTSPASALSTDSSSSSSSSSPRPSIPLTKSASERPATSQKKPKKKLGLFR